ncbi:hypothetical protein U4V41_25600, partial [Escherichia coli]|nr:hypothetical protein [Escherichia coli]
TLLLQVSLFKKQAYRTIILYIQTDPMNIPLSVSSKLPPLRPRKSRPLRRKRRKARSPGLKGITLTSSLLFAS